MHRRTHFFFAAILLITLAYWMVQRSPTVAVPNPPAVLEGTVQPVTTVSDDERQRQFDHLEQERKTYADEISRRDSLREKRQRAGARTEGFRKQLQFSRSDAWAKMIASNAPAYQKIRAAAAIHGSSPCTLCNGRGTMSLCVLCGNSGQCPSCNGTGQFEGDLCPTCIGSGKCYLCVGKGRMICPFCDDGEVGSKAPLPPQSLPLH